MIHVVWDFGGVLFRWRPAVLLQRVLPLRAPDAASAERWCDLIFRAPDGDWSRFDRGTIEEDELVQRLAALSGFTELEMRAVIDAVPAELEPQPEAVALLHALRERGVRQSYLSNMPAPYARWLEREHAFLRDFDGGLFSSDVKLIKPEPGIFALAEQRFGLDPAHALFIDDYVANVDAARARGWRAVLAEGPASIERGLRAYGVL